MKKLLACLVVLVLLTVPALAVAETTEILSLERASEDMAEAIQENPVNVAKAAETQFNFWKDLLLRFAETAKPNVVFNKDAFGGLQITLYEAPSGNWEVVAGKIFRYSDVDLLKQPGFAGVEWKGFPLLKDLAEIFEDLNPQILYSEKQIKVGLTYEFK